MSLRSLCEGSIEVHLLSDSEGTGPGADLEGLKTATNSGGGTAS